MKNRKNYTDEFKLRLVLDVIKEDATINEVY